MTSSLYNQTVIIYWMAPNYFTGRSCNVFKSSFNKQCNHESYWFWYVFKVSLVRLVYFLSLFWLSIWLYCFEVSIVWNVLLVCDFNFPIKWLEMEIFSGFSLLFDISVVHVLVRNIKHQIKQFKAITLDISPSSIVVFWFICLKFILIGNLSTQRTTL